MANTQKESDSEVKVKIRRVLEINTGLKMLENNEEISLDLSFKLGQFKNIIEQSVTLFNEQYAKIKKKFEIEVTDGIKMPDPKKADEQEAEFEKLLNKEVDIRLVYFKVKDFKIELEREKSKSAATPKFFTLMGDLVTQ